MSGPIRDLADASAWLDALIDREKLPDLVPLDACDLAWYWLVTVALARGAAGAGRLPRAIYFSAGLLLVGFGLWFLWGAAGR